MEKFHFDLQLFAEETVNINATTDAALSVENKTFYDRALIEGRWRTRPSMTGR